MEKTVKLTTSLGGCQYTSSFGPCTMVLPLMFTPASSTSTTRPFNTGIYLVLGKVVEEFGFPSLEVEKMAKMPFQANPKA